MRHAVLFLLVLSAAACERGVAVESVLTVTDVHTGWYDAGIQADRKNKLVPSISLKLKNISTDGIRNVQVNAIFRRVGEAEAWGEHFVMAIGRDGLEAGGTSKDLVLRSNLGYTAEQA